MWFTETPWPPIIILSVFAITSASWWISRRQLRYLITTVICGAAIAGTYVAERLIISDRERIEASVFDMAAAFGQRDENGVLQHISPRQDELTQLVKWALATVTGVNNLRITDVSVEMLSQGSRARCHFRANGRFEVIGFGDIGHQATRWELTWQREGGAWKVIRIRRLNPITGEEMDQRSARE